MGTMSIFDPRVWTKTAPKPKGLASHHTAHVSCLEVSTRNVRCRLPSDLSKNASTHLRPCTTCLSHTEFVGRALFARRGVQTSLCAASAKEDMTIAAQS